jgi:hypothetical protein
MIRHKVSTMGRDAAVVVIADVDVDVDVLEHVIVAVHLNGNDALVVIV